MPQVACPGFLTVLLLGQRLSLSVREDLVAVPAKQKERAMVSFEALEF